MARLFLDFNYIQSFASHSIVLKLLINIWTNPTNFVKVFIFMLLLHVNVFYCFSSISSVIFKLLHRNLFFDKVIYLLLNLFLLLTNLLYYYKSIIPSCMFNLLKSRLIFLTLGFFID